MGDLDGDGKVATADAILALRSIAGIQPLTMDQARLADVNGDGALTAGDVALILQRSVGLVGDFGSAPLEEAAPVSPVSVTIQENETLFSWPKTGRPWSHLRFIQNGVTVSLDRPTEALEGREGVRLRRYLSHIVAPGKLGNDYAPFASLLPNLPTSISVSTSTIASDPGFTVGDLMLKPVIHEFDPGVYGPADSEIHLSVPFVNRVSLGQTVTVAGQTLMQTVQGSPSQGLRADAFIVPPVGLPFERQLSTSGAVEPSGVFGPRLPSGADFSLSFTPDREGTWLVEINTYPGYAAVNQPVYVGDGTPLIPNPLDFQTLTTSGPLTNAAALMAGWLTLINRDRAQYGLAPVTQESALSASGQVHTDEMALYRYVGHTGMDGSDPQTRATRAGVSSLMLIGENLGAGVTVEELQAALMASAAHRLNLLNPNWKRVGLAVSKGADGLLYGAQEFGVEAGDYNIQPDYFEGVQLAAPAPTGFVPGQAIHVRGRVTRAARAVWVFFRHADTGRYATFPKAPVAVDTNGAFDIAVEFAAGDVGRWVMGISLDGAVSNGATVVVRH